ncbi:MAG: HAMP domain-containing sensor histidine kinase [Acutalibacteraceae bacterium]|nr:HAMP domain-containing sensor histidine kinase [Acutalibacteraceae bacterium]HIR03501.1 HAMP domain-containing histidine kinase [Candidatus Scatovicinus merdipullorum]
MRKGITRRWIVNTLGIILAILITIIVVLSFVIQTFYYNGIQQTISGRSNELVNFFGNYTAADTEQFNVTAREYVENFPDKEMMELMVINSYGKVIITSTGFAPDESEPMPDYEQAKENPEGFGMWTGRLSSGEDVMTVTRVIQNTSGDTIGAVRYAVSLEAANRKIFLTIAALILAGLLVTFFVVISGAYFIRSIVNPVREMSATAKRIAQGDFEAKLDKMHDDEIGELCDSINYMAGELAASEQLKNDFISSVSHELRTPLTAIKGWAETMQLGGTADPKTMEKGMSVIVKESERLTGIVEELLDFSRIQSGRMVLTMDKIDLLAELDEAIYMLRERALSENKHLLYDEPDHVPAVMGDKNRLRQVFINIIDNALKYTPASGVIGIQVSYDDQNLKITISDNGCGIPAEHLPRIKDKFYKANQTVRGSGIGLAVADEIMQLHNGSLEIESTEGVGTTVTLTIPVVSEDEEQQS